MKIDSKRLLPLIPAVLFFHNLEEALTMPHWLAAHLPELQEKVPLFRSLEFSRTQIFISLILVTVVPLIITILCLRGEQTRRKISVLLTLQSIIFWNALMPHISGIFVLGMYNPGTVTAVAGNVPFSILLFYLLWKEQTIETRVLMHALIDGLFLYLPAVYLNHLLAHRIASLL
ncbi:MAG: HXXEE domain-containing protein [Bacteroidota bacterium]